MRGWGRAFGGLVTVWLLVGCASYALAAVMAAVTLPSAPGWNDDVELSPEARALADSWAAAMQGTANSVRGTRSPDDFVEIAVVVHQRRPLAPRVMTDPDRALASLRDSLAPVFDASAPPERAEFMDIDGVASLRARWIVDGVVWETVLVPEGFQRAVVIMRARQDEMVFYEDTFRSFVEGLSGAEPPVVPISRKAWRFGGGGAMVLLGAALFLIMLATGDHSDEYELAGQRAARAQAIAAVLAGAGAYAYLDLLRREAVLAAGTSTMPVVAELTLVGLAVAGALLLIGRGMDPGQTKIQSAPNMGAYAQAGRQGGARPTGDQSAGVPAPVEDLPPR